MNIQEAFDKAHSWHSPLRKEDCGQCDENKALALAVLDKAWNGSLGLSDDGEEALRMEIDALTPTGSEPKHDPACSGCCNCQQGRAGER